MPALSLPSTNGRSRYRGVPGPLPSERTELWHHVYPDESRVATIAPLNPPHSTRFPPPLPAITLLTLELHLPYEVRVTTVAIEGFCSMGGGTSITLPLLAGANADLTTTGTYLRFRHLSCVLFKITLF